MKFYRSLENYLWQPCGAISLAHQCWILHSSTEMFPAYLSEYGLAYAFLKFSLWYTFSRFMLLAQPGCLHFPQVFYNGLCPAVQVLLLGIIRSWRKFKKKQIQLIQQGDTEVIVTVYSRQRFNAELCRSAAYLLILCLNANIPLQNFQKFS